MKNKNSIAVIIAVLLMLGCASCMSDNRSTRYEPVDPDAGLTASVPPTVDGLS